MRVVFITQWFSENMGYAENLFPKAIAKLGHDVHVISSNVQVYYDSINYNKVYEPFIGPNIVECGTKIIDGFVLHRLPYFVKRGKLQSKFCMNGLGIRGLDKKLEELKPDIIQTFNIAEIAAFVTAKYCKKNKAKFFSESHMHASVFRSGEKETIIEKFNAFLNRFNPALKLIVNSTQLCYAIAPDVAEIAETFYRVPKYKIKIQSLGIDTDLFQPLSTEEHYIERERIRNSFGIDKNDIVCIYTGRFTKDKNPVCLAQAINHINASRNNFKAIFLGNGTDEENDFIKAQRGCYIHPFVKLEKLPSYYRAADIGVWPREESTSQLDAAACGLPLILSNKVKVIERINGNGFLYEEGNYFDLANKILMLNDLNVRKKMSAVGVNKVTSLYSWDAISQERLKDYNEALNSNLLYKP